MLQGQLQAGAQEEKGENARLVSKGRRDRRPARPCLCSGSAALIPGSAAPLSQASFVGAMAIADLVKSTLGPKGMVSSGGGLDRG